MFLLCLFSIIKYRYIFSNILYFFPYMVLIYAYIIIPFCLHRHILENICGRAGRERRQPLAERIWP